MAPAVALRHAAMLSEWERHASMLIGHCVSDINVGALTTIDDNCRRSDGGSVRRGGVAAVSADANRSTASRRHALASVSSRRAIWLESREYHSRRRRSSPNSISPPVHECGEAAESPSAGRLSIQYSAHLVYELRRREWLLEEWDPTIDPRLGRGPGSPYLLLRLSAGECFSE